MKFLILLLALPLFATPWMLGCLDPTSAIYPTMRLMVWFYPFYMLLSSWLAWRSMRERPTVTWVLLVLEILTTAAIVYAVLQ